MKRCAPLLLALLFLGGCGAPGTAGPRQYQATFLTLFDTVTTVVGYGSSEAEFQAQAQRIHDQLLEYHQLFDIYGDYEGMNNLKTVNDNAGSLRWRWMGGSSRCFWTAESCMKPPGAG